MPGRFPAGGILHYYVIHARALRVLAQLKSPARLHELEKHLTVLLIVADKGETLALDSLGVRVVNKEPRASRKNGYDDQRGQGVAAEMDLTRHGSMLLHPGGGSLTLLDSLVQCLVSCYEIGQLLVERRENSFIDPRVEKRRHPRGQGLSRLLNGVFHMQMDLRQFALEVLSFNEPRCSLTRVPTADLWPWTVC